MPNDTHKTRLTRSEYLVVVALFYLAHKKHQESLKFSNELAELLGYEDDYMGCVTDCIYEPDSDQSALDKALEAEGINVDR